MNDTEQQLQAALESGNDPKVDELAKILNAEDEKRQTRLERPEAIVAAALWYAQQGVTVFPCSPRGKAPLTTHGFKDASSDRDQISTWWDRWPEANLAAPTGHLFDVIDIDGPDGIASIAGRIEALRPQMIGKASTPRPGGLHLFIAADPNRRNNTKIAAGVDTRASGGYVLLPPSVTDEHGPDRRYTWLQPLNVGGGSQ